MNIWDMFSGLSAWVLGLAAAIVFLFFLKDVGKLVRSKGKRSNSTLES